MNNVIKTCYYNLMEKETKYAYEFTYHILAAMEL